MDSDAFSEDDEGAQLSEEEDTDEEDADEDEGHGTSSGSDGDSATRTTRERSRRIPAARRTTSRTVRVTVIAGISTWWISTEIHPSRTP